jgi:hypothetical protein
MLLVNFESSWAGMEERSTQTPVGELLGDVLGILFLLFGVGTWGL